MTGSQNLSSCKKRKTKMNLKVRIGPKLHILFTLTSEPNFTTFYHTVIYGESVKDSHSRERGQNRNNIKQKQQSVQRRVCVPGQLLF